MEFYAHHGHFEEEKIIGGRFTVDITIETDVSRASETDDLNDAVDYSRVYEAVQHEMMIPAKLLEHLAKRIVDAVCLVSARIEKVTVTVSKLNPAIGGKMDKFSVMLTR
jgi:dihydroneopterin aldolase